MIEGDEAAEAVAEAARRTTARRDLASNENFDQVSPEVGVLDEQAFEELADKDLDAALTLVARMVTATDVELRARARALAARILVDLARTGAARRRGIGRYASRRASLAEGDVDLDRSMDAIVTSRAEARPVDADDLWVRGWERPDTALCLLVDRSGSMTGDRLATAALAAAAVTYRHGHDCSVIAFSANAIVLKSQLQVRHADGVADDLLQLRGHGVTDLGLAVRTAANQLGTSTAARRVTLLLSDARSTSGADPTPDAAALAALGELVVLCPADDRADAERLASATGARLVPIDGPGDVPRALAEALG